MRHCGTLWTIVGGYGTLWNIVEQSPTPLYTSPPWIHTTTTLKQAGPMEQYLSATSGSGSDSRWAAGLHLDTCTVWWLCSCPAGVPIGGTGDWQIRTYKDSGKAVVFCRITLWDLWTSVGQCMNCETLWNIVEHCGNPMISIDPMELWFGTMLWNCVAHCGILWNIVEHCGNPS